MAAEKLQQSNIWRKIIEKFHEIHPLVVFDIYTANADQIRQRMDEGLSDIGLYWNRQT